MAIIPIKRPKTSYTKTTFKVKRPKELQQQRYQKQERKSYNPILKNYLSNPNYNVKENSDGSKTIVSKDKVNYVKRERSGVVYQKGEYYPQEINILPDGTTVVKTFSDYQATHQQNNIVRKVYTPTVKTYDKDGNLIREIQYDTFTTQSGKTSQPKIVSKQEYSGGNLIKSKQKTYQNTQTKTFKKEDYISGSGYEKVFSTPQSRQEQQQKSDNINLKTGIGLRTQSTQTDKQNYLWLSPDTGMPVSVKEIPVLTTSPKTRSSTTDFFSTSNVAQGMSQQKQFAPIPGGYESFFYEQSIPKEYYPYYKQATEASITPKYDVTFKRPPKSNYERRIRGQIEREEKIDKKMNQLFDKFGLTKVGQPSPFKQPKTFLVETGKAAGRAIPSVLGTVEKIFPSIPQKSPGRIGIVAEGLLNKEGREVAFEGLKELPKALGTQFNPLTPEGLVNVALIALPATKVIGKGIKSVKFDNAIKEIVSESTDTGVVWESDMIRTKPQSVKGVRYIRQPKNFVEPISREIQTQLTPKTLKYVDEIEVDGLIRKKLNEEVVQESTSQRVPGKTFNKNSKIIRIDLKDKGGNKLNELITTPEGLLEGGKPYAIYDGEYFKFGENLNKYVEYNRPPSIKSIKRPDTSSQTLLTDFPGKEYVFWENRYLGEEPLKVFGKKNIAKVRTTSKTPKFIKPYTKIKNFGQKIIDEVGGMSTRSRVRDTSQVSQFKQGYDGGQFQDFSFKYESELGEGYKSLLTEEQLLKTEPKTLGLFIPKFLQGEKQNVGQKVRQLQKIKPISLPALKPQSTAKEKQRIEQLPDEIQSVEQQPQTIERSKQMPKTVPFLPPIPETPSPNLDFPLPSTPGGEGSSTLPPSFLNTLSKLKKARLNKNLKNWLTVNPVWFPKKVVKFGGGKTISRFLPPSSPASMSMTTTQQFRPPPKFLPQPNRKKIVQKKVDKLIGKKEKKSTKMSRLFKSNKKKSIKF